MGKIATIVINNCTRLFDKEYDYIVPEELINLVKRGTRVIVPFGVTNKLSEGYVLSLKEIDEKCSLSEKYKYVHKVIDPEPVLTDEMIKIAHWMKEKYICTWADAIKCFLPAGTAVKAFKFVKLKEEKLTDKKNWNRIIEYLRQNDNLCSFDELKKLKISRLSSVIDKMQQLGILDVKEQYTTRVQEKYERVAFLKGTPDEIVEAIDSGKIRSIQQIRVLELLLENEHISTADLVRFSGVSNSVLNTLKKNGYIDFKEIEVKRDPLIDKHIERTQPLTPTEQQTKVLEKVKSFLDMYQYKEILLHGITGSGKTEVYLQLIKHVLDMGREAIVLVPEISLTPQMVERFKGRFGDTVAVLHSRLSLGERYDQWKSIMEGKIKVAIGARSAIFAPFTNIGIIIIDEEHESTYKSEVNPKYHAVEIAQRRCDYNNAVLLYGSATPSVETYYRAITGQILLMEMTERPNKQELPPIDIIDMRRELREGNRSIFSRKLDHEMRKNIEENLQTILFLNRRGHSSFVLCRDCGYVVKCKNCNISLTYHANDNRLICHYCGYTTKNPRLCPQCKSIYIRYFGIGTQKVEEEVRRTFPEGTVIRMDMDTTNYKNAHEEILSAFKNENINTLVGTQMIAKGHDFPKVTLVGVLAADGLLNTGDYKATERTFQLITQVAGRAGRGRHSGKVIVQTYNVEDFSIQAASKHDYKEFYAQEILLRKQLEYPPFTNIAVILLSGIYDKNVYMEAGKIKNEIIELTGNTSCELLGPARAPLSKIKNRYRWRIVLKCKDREQLISILTQISDGFYRDKRNKNIRLSVDINPVNLM